MSTLTVHVLHSWKVLTVSILGGRESHGPLRLTYYENQDEELSNIIIFNMIMNMTTSFLLLIFVISIMISIISKSKHDNDNNNKKKKKTDEISIASFLNMK